MPAAEDLSNPVFAEFARVFEHFKVDTSAEVRGPALRAHGGGRQPVDILQMGPA